MKKKENEFRMLQALKGALSPGRKGMLQALKGVLSPGEKVMLQALREAVLT